MKLFKIALTAAFAFAATSAYAFHAGGVAECGGCHSMHSPPTGAPVLLVGTDPSSACLSCHEHAGDTGPSSYHVSTAPADMPAGVAPLQRGPGGDFGWLKKSYTLVVRNNTVTEAGETHGHNIIAADKLYTRDSRNTVSPGGNYDATNFHCNSCHDPHGKFRRLQGSDAIVTSGAPIYTSGSYNNATTNEPIAGAAVGVYRLLGGNGYAPTTVPVPGFAGVPPAKVKSGYNSSEATTQTRVAYGVVAGAGNTTWSQWCATCHAEMHTLTTSRTVHPVDQPLPATMLTAYNAYVSSGNLNGNAATAFSSLAPFATDGGATYASLNGTSASTAGPVSGDRVICLSCHRAHASGFQNMLRFDLESTFITSNGAYSNYLNKTTAETQAAYYDRAPTAFATYQRVWCNKCHVKD